MSMSKTSMGCSRNGIAGHCITSSSVDIRWWLKDRGIPSNTKNRRLSCLYCETGISYHISRSSFHLGHVKFFFDKNLRQQKM